jgi:tRNA1(Val) A37 N6-methylase TrmN6
LDELPDLIDLHLSENGVFGVVLPTDPFVDLSGWLEERHIYGRNICDVSSYENGKCIRRLGMFSKTSTEYKNESRFIYNTDKSRSSWYADLTKEFYLK